MSMDRGLLIRCAYYYIGGFIAGAWAMLVWLEVNR
jgi:hypothetical protein